SAKAQLDDPAVELWGPLPAVMARRADRHRAQLVLVSKSRSRLNQILADLCQTLDSRRQPSQLRWQVDVDPLETG
ncbi:MAG: hypothetical protein KGY54_09610, partial [Oleiphilaceae bacterium]|nr:hypothetical protein [Oleiphilaceae bacterium]